MTASATPGHLSGQNDVTYVWAVGRVSVVWGDGTVGQTWPASPSTLR